MNDALGWSFDGSLRPSDQEFQRYVSSLEIWAQWHAESGWLETREGKDHESFLVWFEETFSGGVA